jgi:class 3 adenylate cyclase
MNRGGVTRVLKYWHTPPPNMQKGHERSFITFTYGCLLGLAGHVFFIVLFGLAGVQPLFHFNFFSVAIWSIALYLVRRGRLFAALQLAMSEYIVHQVLAVALTGWASGFEMLLFIVPLSVFLSPPGRLYLKVLFTVATAAALAGTYIYTLGHPPPYPLPISYEAVLYLSFMVFTTGVLALFGFTFHGSVARADAIAQREYSRSETLLHNILPASVAEELKAKGLSRPVRVESATILFSDFVHFTQATRGIEAISVIAMLNGYFTCFDSLAAKHRIERLKTIGDGYMCAGGVPETNNTHPVDACLMALQMLRHVKLQMRSQDGASWDIRIGINTGSVTAGIVGSSKFSYDIWGESVNIASRHESSGVEGGVNVSRCTYLLTRNLFNFAPRGCIEIKGGETMEMYQLLGVKPEYVTGGKLNAVFRETYSKIDAGALLLGFDI